MSTFFSPRRIEPEPGERLAGGEAGLGAIFGAAYRQMLFVDNFNARERARDAAIDERNDEVFRATGTRPRHPFRTGEVATEAEKIGRWQREVEEASRRLPDTTVADRLNRGLEGDMQRIARDAEGNLARLTGSRPGAAGFVAEMGGAMVGALRDPLTFASLAFGGGPGAARTIAGRILAATAREAGINAGLSAAAQPVVQDWRRQAGLPSGTALALQNVLFAGAAGGVFGAAGQALAEGAAKLLPRAIEGDTAAAAELLAPAREALPAATRGALDAAEQMAHVDAVRPGAAAAEIHDRNVTAAHRIVDASPDGFGEPAPALQVDNAQVSRIAAEIAGPPPLQGRRPKTLVEFLIDRGGLKDEGGELAFMGADRFSIRGRGRLVARKGGESLDYAREAAEQAGYLGRDGETQVATLEDLKVAIDAELRGNPVYAREDMGEVSTVRDHDQAIARLEATVAEVIAAGGPALDDRLVRQAVERVLAQGEDAADAVERVLTKAELDSPTFFHGTPFSFENFDLSRSGTASGSKTERAVFFTPDRQEAANFGLSARGEPQTAYVRQHGVDISGFEVVDMKGARARHHAIREALDDARERNLPGVIFRNMDDRSVMQEAAGAPITDQIAVLDLGRISPAAKIEAVHAYEFFHRDPLPGWSDDELMAASAERGNPPDPDHGGLDAPDMVDDADLISPRDIEEFGDMPFFDDEGGTRTLRGALEEIDADESAAQLIAACRPA